MPALYSRPELADARAGWKRESKIVVFTNGCYDLLHPGHVRLLEQCKSMGDILILALNTDASVARVKTLKIFNRWGNMLFESFDFTSGDESRGWNGTFNSTTLPNDVYIFFAEIEYKDGKKEVFKGDVTLMR